MNIGLVDVQPSIACYDGHFSVRRSRPVSRCSGQAETGTLLNRNCQFLLPPREHALRKR